MSLALIKSGVAFTGRLTIKTGPHKHKKIEIGTKLLADQLHKVFADTYIDLIEPNNQCQSHAYFDCQEAWFWGS